MEQDANFLRQESDISPSIPSRYLLLTLLLFAVLVLAIFGMRELGQMGWPLPNPFAPFADIFPGQPVFAVDVRGFYCEMSGDGDQHLNDYCALDLASGPFWRVGIAVSEEAISNLTFRVRYGAIRVGDLMEMWGRPIIQKRKASINFYWRDRGNTAYVYNQDGQYSLFLPVRSITITTPLPARLG